MTMKLIATDKAPKAIGPYSQAIVSSGLVFCAGQVAIDPATGQLVEGDIAVQTRQVLKNLAAVLDAAGSELKHVLKTTVFLANFDDFAAMNTVYEEAFGGHRPARSTVEVSQLPRGAKVEIEAVALAR
jgi:2-iminobutanoate/2-iminopropanoate deaminase